MGPEERMTTASRLRMMTPRTFRCSESLWIVDSTSAGAGRLLVVVAVPAAAAAICIVRIGDAAVEGDDDVAPGLSIVPPTALRPAGPFDPGGELIIAIQFY